jgi:alpha-galactosidase
MVTGFLSAIILCPGLLSFWNSCPAENTNQPLAATPPIGWNSWNTFGEQINEEVVRGVADKIVALGLKDLGYQYIVIDDHWEGGRDGQGHILANPKKFPHGIKMLADYIHGQGLKLGIYSDAGDQTCGGEVGSYGHEADDAATFASWGVDYLKYDYCNAPDDFQEAIRRYTTMGSALKATGRPIVFSICEWGPRSPWLWGRQAGGELWRISFDVGDIWDTPHDAYSCIGILAAIDASANHEDKAGPGGWNDPDMLVVGLGNKGNVKGGGCTSTEYQTQMSMWCLLAAPLMIGCDIRTMDADTQRILTNPEVIAVDQDKLGKQGNRVARTGSTDVWRKPLAEGRLAVALLNRGDANAEIAADWKALGLEPGANYEVRDLWSHKNLGTYTNSFTAKVGSHETLLLRLVPASGTTVASKTANGDGKVGGSARVIP